MASLGVYFTILWLSWTGSAHSASFYGQSYVSVPFLDARSTTDVFLRFKTQRQDGLILLAAGAMDYLVLVLDRGALKVRLNLGSGESTLSSPAGLRLDDLLWHEVELHRTSSDMSLTIDGIHSTYLDIPGRFSELNVKFGVYVGGMGSFKEIFLGNIDNFRGCIEEVSFNDQDILKLAAEAPDQRNLYGITWDCSEEFEASSYQPISFVERGAYVALPTWNARNGGSLAFSVKTQSQMALLFYHAGTVARNDFVSLEIVHGKLVLSVNEGNGAVVLQSDVVLNDGHWHQIQVQFGPSYIEITTDGQVKSLRQGLGENRFFDLVGYLYVGGIELNKQSRALQQGLQSVLSEGVDSSLKGCLKNIKVNDELMGLKEAEVTQGIKSDCVWEYQCLLNPCVDGAECFHDGTDAFRCLCEEPVCIRSNFTSGYKLYTKSSVPIDMEILSLSPLEVNEGGSQLLTSEHIRVIMDYQKYGVRENGVLFHIVESPKHGSLEIEIWRKSAENIFTLMDLNTDKVRYSHDGGEGARDLIVIELEFRARNFRLPSFLEQRHQFNFHIKVSPVNDPPSIKSLINKVFHLARYTKKTLTSDILLAEDPDNKPSELVYSLVNAGAATEEYIENARKPGEPIESFTQEEINKGLINYVHKGPANSRIVLRVSDGVETGQTIVIRVSTFDLTVSLVNNTGVVLPYGSTAVVTSDNLTFATNAPDQNLEIRYEVTRLPQYGTVQKLRMSNKWHPVNHFTQRQLGKGKIRYQHTSGRPLSDEFKFSISCMNITIPTVYDFRITFINVEMIQVANRELVLGKVLEAHLSDLDLKYKTNPISTAPNQLVYTVSSPPSFGNLVAFQTATDGDRHRRLDSGSTFTQQDVDSKHLKYKLHRKAFSLVNDQFTFRVSAPGGIVLDGLVFKIKHLPSDTDAVVTNERLEVIEGEAAAITSKHLFIKAKDSGGVVYNVTTPPKHGLLRLMTVSLTSIETQPLSTFNNDDLLNRRVVYTHDDSETEHDSFHFSAAAIAEDDDFVYYGTFHVSVLMKNDNPPIREVDKIFHVIQGKERKLTGKDLRYVDADIDSKPSDIHYTRRGIPNGALFNGDNQHSQIFQFTQEDLDEGRIVFRHTGDDYGKAVLWITDGQFYATGILEIQAAKSFIKSTRNTGLTVRRGESQYITSFNLTVETNENATPEEISYKIVSEPKYGEILVNGKEVNQFTQKDLDLETVEYENDNTMTFSDSFTFVAYFGDINTENVFHFRIFPDSYWLPLTIQANKTLYVDEGKHVVIDMTALNVAHANVDPVNITYVVKTPPQYGYLSVGEKERNTDGALIHSVKSFSQATINERRLVYVQTEHNVTEDFFIFDVTNGITVLSDLKLEFNVISNIILLRTGNLTVMEGKDVTLSPEDVDVANPYYVDWIMEYLIVEQPRHGHLSIATSPTKLESFTPAQLRDNMILFVHDGSETLRDWFTLVAKADALKKESAPSTVHVTVEPVNDEAPHLVNNTGLELWEGSVATITSNHLSAADDDSEPDDICFAISSSNNGYVAFKNDTTTPIHGFSQAQINTGLVVYLHTGEKAGGFRFQVNDGMNYDSPHVFIVTARPLKILVTTNEKLYVFPRMQQSVTKDHLNVCTNDAENFREIVYHVTKPPSLGKILLESPDGSLNPVTQFTQNQINKNLVLYEQTQPLSDMSATDTVIFDLETDFAEILRNVKFKVEVSVGNFAAGNLDQLIVLRNFEVEEGGEAVITQKQVNVTKLLDLWQKKGKNEISEFLKITVQSMPRHGILSLDNENITSRKTFERQHLKKKMFRYRHDDSDTFEDDFTLGFFIPGTSGLTDIYFYNGTINITIIPVNDQPFVLETIAPKIEVVQGQSAVISTAVLNTTDKDGIPSDIAYDIISYPGSGIIVKEDNFTVPLHGFTQEEVNRGEIYFVHDGTKNPSTFHFKVSDGKHKPVFKVFHVQVLPLTLEIVNSTEVQILQGHAAVFLQSSNLRAKTNGNPLDVWYNITVPPMYGRIFLGDEVASHFRQKDIDTEAVMYMQLNFSAAADVFYVSVWHDENVIEDHSVNITVVPLIKQRSFDLQPGGHAPLTLDVLDASKLAEQTNSNPEYTILRTPTYGFFSLIVEGNRTTRDVHDDIMEFTHEDVSKGAVILQVQMVNETTPDSFEYLLTAPQVQPARGRFDFVIRTGDFIPSQHDTVSVSTTPPARPASGSPDPTSVDSTGMISPSIIDNDILLIIAVTTSVLLFAMAIVVFIKCFVVRKRKKRRQERQEQALSDGKFPGSLTAQTDLGGGVLPSMQGGGSLSDLELPPPAPPTSPSSTGSGSVSSPRPRTLPNKAKRLTLDSSIPPPPPPLPYLRDSADWTEVSPAHLPTCKVTPLSPVEQDSSGLKTDFCEPSEVSETDDWHPYDGGGDLRYGAPPNPMLGKNQYWV